jgi:hypothetical protein
MYVVLTKNSNDTWDAIAQTSLGAGTTAKTLLDSAFEAGLPIVGMDATAHKSKAKRESVWDGSSFSGGNSKEGALPPDDDGVWTTSKRYVFLCDNKVVLSMSVNNTSSASEMMSAAFAGETILVKTSSGTTNVGKTFTWDGTVLHELSAPE